MCIAKIKYLFHNFIFRAGLISIRVFACIDLEYIYFRALDQKDDKCGNLLASFDDEPIY